MRRRFRRGRLVAGAGRSDRRVAAIAAVQQFAQMVPHPERTAHRRPRRRRPPRRLRRLGWCRRLVVRLVGLVRTLHRRLRAHRHGGRFRRPDPLGLGPGRRPNRWRDIRLAGFVGRRRISGSPLRGDDRRGIAQQRAARQRRVGRRVCVNRCGRWGWLRVRLTWGVVAGPRRVYAESTILFRGHSICRLGH